MKSLLALLVAAVALAIATKPGPERFERYISERLAEAKVDNAKRDRYLDALMLAGIDVLRNGRYDDYVVITRYKMSFLGKPVTTCYGYFSQVSCGHDE